MNYRGENFKIVLACGKIFFFFLNDGRMSVLLNLDQAKKFNDKLGIEQN